MLTAKFGKSFPYRHAGITSIHISERLPQCLKASRSLIVGFVFVIPAGKNLVDRRCSLSSELLVNKALECVNVVSSFGRHDLVLHCSFRGYHWPARGATRPWSSREVRLRRGYLCGRRPKCRTVCRP